MASSTSSTSQRQGDGDRDDAAVAAAHARTIAADRYPAVHRRAEDLLAALA